MATEDELYIAGAGFSVEMSSWSFYKCPRQSCPSIQASLGDGKYIPVDIIRCSYYYPIS